VRYLLDTTLLIDHAKGRPSAEALVRTLFENPNDLYICDIVVAEALSGGSEIERGGINALMRAVEYVSIPPGAAVWAGASRQTSRAIGPRSLADALIAGLAWSLRAMVVTRNPKDFERQGVPVLAYE
jgi:Predicted nucleic acid-binding protein, contains PIN domain